MNIAVIFAGGSGVRMGAGVPKQFLEINGKPILIYTVQLFENHEDIDKIYLAVPEAYVDYVGTLLGVYHITKAAAVIPGGSTSQDTIYSLLKKVEEENPEDSIVLIHDGVRPFISYEVISKNIACAKEFGNAITVTSCNETILISRDGEVADHVPLRKETYGAQAPQTFVLRDIISAHDQVRATENGYENMVDACTIMRKLNRTVHMVEGNRGNLKVTTPEDVYMFRALLQYKEHEQTFGLGLTNQINALMMQKMRHKKEAKDATRT